MDGSQTGFLRLEASMGSCRCFAIMFFHRCSHRRCFRRHRGLTSYLLWWRERLCSTSCLIRGFFEIRARVCVSLFTFVPCYWYHFFVFHIFFLFFSFSSLDFIFYPPFEGGGGMPCVRLLFSENLVYFYFFSFMYFIFLLFLFSFLFLFFLAFWFSFFFFSFVGTE